MKLGETTDTDLRVQRFDYIDQRWKQLHELEIKRGDTAINYLFLVSGGASAAVLAFIGNIAKEGTPIPQSAVWMLGCFAASLIFVGAMKGAIALHVISIYKNWRELVRRYYTDDIGWKALEESDESVVRRWEAFHIGLGAVAFVAIVAGVVIGFLKLHEESLSGRKAEQTSGIVTTKASAKQAGEASRGVVEQGEQGRRADSGGGPSSAATATTSEEVKPDKGKR